MTYKLRILSLGAGVQSSTLLLMAEKGVIQPFDCAIFADTGWEGKATYDWLDWLKQTCKTPIIVTGKDRNIMTDHLTHKKNCLLPVYTQHNGNNGMSHRLCTNEYKLVPIKKEVRNLLGLVPKQRSPKDAVEQVVGISLDEMRRMRISQERMSFLSYPLVEMRMTRHDCMNWLNRNGYPIPPKSSCVGCPFHSNREWKSLAPQEWKEAVALDNRIRNIHGMKATLYLHKSRLPLEEVDLSTPEERGQGAFDFVKDEKLNLFVNNLSIA